ncbi:MAG TPA: PaeR7I family type II restriction endonuclease [Acidobacteriaceae bacterium]|nr:PaeR7I family type II restriction endonuclease [Acidobacteriaceae bacterium]
MSLSPRWEEQVREAVRHFWLTRETQSNRQGTKSGSRDAGRRTAVTGGKQLDGFVELVRDYLEETGIGKPNIYCERTIELPGWYRAEKQWDLLVIVENCLVAATEFKSQVGSFGNNFNNRTEEALGSATDLWAAYREGAFAPSPRPWLGYVMMLEEAEQSLKPVGVSEPHFKVFDEFHGASYAKRYEILLTKLVRDRHYDSAALMLLSQQDGLNGEYRESSAEMSFAGFLNALLGRAMSFVRKE